MRKGLAIVIAAGVVLAIGAAADRDGIRQLVRAHVSPAEAAYVLLEEDPLSGGTFERAAGLIQRARQRDTRAPWVYIALAKATLVYGYQQGSRYRAASFLPEAVDRARTFSNRAVSLGPEVSFAHAFRGRIAIMDGQPGRARGLLDRAQQLDSASFYPWYYRSILHRHAGDYDAAREYLHQAERRRERHYQARWILESRRDIASGLNDAQHAEELHVRIIGEFPESAQARTEYGSFLIREERYDEAVVQLEKALEIAPYPPARRHLADARRLAGNGPAAAARP